MEKQSKTEQLTVVEHVKIDGKRFVITIEVVPPASSDPSILLSSLRSLADLNIDGFSVATNPVAKARMSALSLCAIVQRQVKKPAILHVTTRDHNRLSLQGLLWGAKAQGVDTVIAMTGDFVALKDRGAVSTVRDIGLFELVSIARETGLQTGVVLDPHPERNGFEREIKRLEKKVAAGAMFAVTQPVYDEQAIRSLADATRHINIPLILGILPLRTSRHAEFLHEKVAGISVPKAVRERMANANNPVAEGVDNARETLAAAREYFAGACLMPPFDHFEVMHDILS